MPANRSDGTQPVCNLSRNAEYWWHTHLPTIRLTSSEGVLDIHFRDPPTMSRLGKQSLDVVW
jgi:hypothetical protein